MTLSLRRSRLARIALACVLPALSATAAAPATTPSTLPSAQVGRIEHPPIDESSGLVASRRQAGVFWTHNDSGGEPVLYAIDRAGRLLGEWRVRAKNTDWEDIAIDDAGHLYIADIGNNTRRRKTVEVLKVAEPTIDQAADQPLAVVGVCRLAYPDEPFDAEALFIHGGRGYVISKDRTGRPAGLYAFDPGRTGVVQTMRFLGPLPVRAPVTAADVSADGKWLAVMTVAGPKVFEMDGDIGRIAEAPSMGVLYLNATMEAVTFVEDGLLATTEGRQVLLFTWEQLRSGQIILEPAK